MTVLRIPGAQAIVIDLGYHPSDFFYCSETIKALCAGHLNALRSLSLAHVNGPQVHMPTFPDDQSFFRTAPRTLTDVIVYNCSHFSLRQLLKDQPALRTLEADMGWIKTERPPHEVWRTWNNLTSITVERGGMWGTIIEALVR